jgi:mono/diheme cytochrome c family protein
VELGVASDVRRETTRVGRGLGLALGLLGLASCAAVPDVRRWFSDAPLDHGSIEEARDSYLRACASCHGPEGRGDGPVAAALAGAAPDLTHLAERHGGEFPREFVIDVVSGEREIAAHGTRAMPVWSQRFGPISGATAAAALYARRRLEMLASYVESLQRRSGSQPGSSP